MSLLTTCLALFGGGSIAVESGQFLADVETLDAETAKTASSFDTRLGEVAATAETEVAEPLQAMQIVFQDFVQAWEDSDTWSLDTESYDAARDEITEVCSAELDAAGAAESEPTPTPTPELTEEGQTEKVFLKNVRTAHPNLESLDGDEMVALAKSFCMVHGRGGKSVVESMMTAAAGIEYTLQEFRSLNHAGVTAFCPEHLDQLG